MLTYIDDNEQYSFLLPWEKEQEILHPTYQIISDTRVNIDKLMI